RVHVLETVFLGQTAARCKLRLLGFLSASMAGSAVGWISRSRRRHRPSLSDRRGGHVLPAAFAAAASARVGIRRDFVRARRDAAVAEQPTDGALRDELDAVAGPLHAPIFPGTPPLRLRAGCARSRP